MAQSSSSPPRSSPGCLLLGVIGVLSFACGLLLGHLTANDWQPSDAGARRLATMEILEAVGKLDRDVKDLRASMNAPRDPIAAPSSPSERKPVARDAELEAFVQRLEKALLEFDPTRAPTKASQGSTRPGRSSIDAIKGEFDVRGGTPLERESLTNELTQAHLLWTVDDLIERYGIPRRVGGSGGGQLNFFYAFGTDDRLYPRPSARFVVQEGRVIHVDVDD